MLTVYSVNSLIDSTIMQVDGLVTLREAIEAANTNLPAGDADFGSPIETDVIQFDPTLFASGAVQLTLVGIELSVFDKLRIEGPGAELLTIDGDNASRIFSVSNTEFTIVGLTVSDGKVTSANGGGINSNTSTVTIEDSVFSGNSADYGGGIFVDVGDLTVTGTVFSNNKANASGGGLYVNGYTAFSTAFIDRATFSGNSAQYGGGFLNDSGYLVMTNSVMSGNSVTQAGGAIFSFEGTDRITNSTLAGNSSDSYGGGIYEYYGDVTVTNSIVSLNSAPNDADISGTLNVASGFNLIGVAPGFVRNPSDGGDGWGDDPSTPGVDESANDDFGDLHLLPTSDAVNAGSDALAVDEAFNPLTLDRDGEPRFNGTVDIGAYEYYTGTQAFAVDDEYLDLQTGQAHVLDVLTNDVYPGGATVEVLIDQDPELGAATANPDGTITFTPWYTFAATDTFTYTLVVDSVPSGTATVSLGLLGSGSIPVSTATDEVDSDYSPGDLSLREALVMAKEQSADWITFDNSIHGQTITLTLGQLTIDTSVEIEGPGAPLMILEGNDQSRVFEVTTADTIAFSGLTILGGRAEGDGSDSNDDYGGGLYVNNAYATVTVSDCYFIENTAPRTSATANFGSGGAIASRGDLTILGCHFEDNSASGSGGALDLSASSTTVVLDSVFSWNSVESMGGAIHNKGETTLERCALVDNEATGLGNGGAINNQSSGDLTLINCTLSGNSGLVGGGVLNYGVFEADYCTIANNSALNGGGLVTAGSTLLSNTIIADNTANSKPDVSGTVASQGHNLIGDTSGSTGFGAAGDLLNVDPRLYPLTSDGSTWTHALWHDSPAINAAKETGAPADDQRGVARPQRGGYDIGAHEASQPMLVSTPVDELDGDYSPGDLSLREAIFLASGDPGLNTIAFAPNVFGQPIVLQLGQLTIDSDLEILGPGANGITVDADGQSRVFEVLDDVTAQISGLTVTGGATEDTTSDDNEEGGGGIQNHGDLTLIDMLITGNSVTGLPSGGGGGVWSEGAIEIIDSIISGNSVDNSYGGGISFRPGTATMTRVTVTGNSTTLFGGGIASYSTLSITDSVISNNEAQMGGGILNNGPLTMTGSSVSANVATEYVGGIDCIGGPVLLTDSDIIGNTSAIVGGIEVVQGDFVMDGCRIQGNTARIDPSVTNSGKVGGLIKIAGAMTITNSLIVGNEAEDSLGGIYVLNNLGTLNIVNSTIAGNVSANIGGGVLNDGGNTTISNSIIALNSALSSVDLDGVPVPVVHSSLIGVDPGFVRNPSDGGDGWGDDPDTPGVDESANDDYGDLRLRFESVAREAGDNALAKDAQGNPLTVDLAGLPRIIYGTVDQGAYEYVMPGDATLDGEVNADDARTLGQHWLSRDGVSWTDGDFNGDGVVDDLDASIMAANWGQQAETLPIEQPEPVGRQRLIGPRPMAAQLAKPTRSTPLTMTRPSERSPLAAAHDLVLAVTPN
ncbi:MAG: hypothetical protein JW818_23035, partial [Pirellulales bacterium]|nr:hypothetical protein [Pirellulales bacterium]